MENSLSNKPVRNYELECLKLIFSIFVFFSHLAFFIGPNTTVSLPPMLGSVSVQFFFIVSGMLMANSICRAKSDCLQPGKLAITYVLQRFKNLAWRLGSSLILFLFSMPIIYPKNEILVRLTSIFPELFMVNTAGIYEIRFNRPTWYISSMLIVMLPLSYLLYKKKDFTLNVLAPLTAILTLGYMYQVGQGQFITDKLMYGFIMGGMIRAICGLCFGICAYNIYKYITNTYNKNIRLLLTIAEILLYGIIFFTWFVVRDTRSIMSVMLLLPIAVAITFSEKSYVIGLFKYKWMKHFAPISLLIYLNHELSMEITAKIVENKSYKICILVSAVLTLVACLLSMLIVNIGKFLWEKKLKSILTKSDN